MHSTLAFMMMFVSSPIFASVLIDIRIL